MSKPSPLAFPFCETARKSARGVLGGLLLCSALLMATAANGQSPPPIPDTPKKLVVDEYHGVKVADNYRWLEDWNDPAAREWSNAQNRRARAYLDGLAVREPIRKWLRETSNATSTSYHGISVRGKAFFAMRMQPPNQPF